MKAILLLLVLIGLLNSKIIRLKYHKCTDKIYSGRGLVALELQEFETDDPIYITYTAYDGNIHDYVNYRFTDEFPYDEDMYLPNNKDPYSKGTTSHKHNVSDGYGGWRVYYTYDHHYYYEFKKPENKTYLVMHYNLAGYSNKYIDIDNTYLGRYLTVIIICSVVGGIILIGGGIFFFIKYRDRISCPRCDCDCLSCLCDCSCPCPWRRSYSYNISTSSYNNTPEKKDLLLIDSTTNNSNSAPKDLEIKNPVPEADYGEKPYFEQNYQPTDNYNIAENNQYPNPNEINYPQPGYAQAVPPPNNYYAQPGMGYNPNDPLSQNNVGYNTGNYTGEGGIY